MSPSTATVRALQAATALFGLVAVVTGAVAMQGAGTRVYAEAGVPVVPLLDSNLRFLGGLWLAAGLALLWLVPGILRQGVLFRALCGAIFIGGIGRALSLLQVGMPSPVIAAVMVVELLAPPLLVLAQWRVSRLPPARAAATTSAPMHGGDATWTPNDSMR